MNKSFFIYSTMTGTGYVTAPTLPLPPFFSPNCHRHLWLYEAPRVPKGFCLFSYKAEKSWSVLLFVAHYQQYYKEQEGYTEANFCSSAHNKWFLFYCMEDL